MSTGTLTPPTPELVLEQTAPGWIDLHMVYRGGLRFYAQPVRAGGVKTRRYDLQVNVTSAEIRISESVPGTLLPSFCPERHINSDGSFCLGWEAGKNISSNNAAEGWWRKLLVFLSCQEVARAIGHWPREAYLSHGEAGRLQVMAEFLADKLGRRNSYNECLRHQTGPIADDARNYGTARNVLRNGPVSCSCNSPQQVSECTTRNYECLIAIEARRCQEEQRFWEAADRSICCETMSTCLIGRANKQPSFDAK